MVLFGDVGCAGGTITVSPATDRLNSFVAGFIAAEGSLVQSGRRFGFAVALGADDAPMCQFLLGHFGVGAIYRSPRRQEHFQDEVVYRVQRLDDLVHVVVPFLDRWLAPSYKRTQYDSWRAALLRHHASRRRRLPCSTAGCDTPSRAKGLCRRCYYLKFGR
jgi:hypothetical protein